MHIRLSSADLWLDAKLIATDQAKASAGLSFPACEALKKGVEKTNTTQSRELGNKKTSEEQSKANIKRTKTNRGALRRIAVDWPSIALALALWLWRCSSDSGWGSTPPVLNSNVKSRSTWFSARPRWPSGLSACPCIVSSDLQPESLTTLSSSVSFCLACLPCLCLFSVFSFLGIAAGGDTSVWG